MGGPERSHELFALEALLSVSHYEKLADGCVCCDKSLFTDEQMYCLQAAFPALFKNDFLITNFLKQNMF